MTELMMTESETEPQLRRLTLQLLLAPCFLFKFFFYLSLYVQLEAGSCLSGGSLPSGVCAGLCHSRETESIFETANEDSVELPARNVELAAPL